MPETSRALRLQAANAIAENEALTQKLSACININLDDKTATVDIDVETLRSVLIRLDNDSVVMQKQDSKITRLENDLFTA